jgi:hypothetical protein
VKFVEEGDGQPIHHGDYGPYRVGGLIHFVRFNTTETRPLGLKIGGIWPDEETLCGMPVPDWREVRVPIAGQVDCSACIEQAGAFDSPPAEGGGSTG